MVVALVGVTQTGLPLAGVPDEKSEPGAQPTITTGVSAAAGSSA